MQIKGKNKFGFDIYELSDAECEDLFVLAENAKQFIYPKDAGGFSVALLTKSGKQFHGASYKSDTHNLTMHSEAVALARAANEGETEIVAITGPNCHNCKQLLWESSIRSKIDTVIVMKEDGRVIQVPISEMMPYPWPDHNGNK